MFCCCLNYNMGTYKSQEICTHKNAQKYVPIFVQVAY